MCVKALHPCYVGKVGVHFDMCLIQQSLIFHSKKCYTKESHSLVKSTFLTLIITFIYILL